MFTINEYASSNENGQPQVEVTESMSWPPKSWTYDAIQLSSGTWVKKSNGERLPIKNEVELFVKEFKSKT